MANFLGMDDQAGLKVTLGDSGPMGGEAGLAMAAAYLQRTQGRAQTQPLVAGGSTASATAGTQWAGAGSITSRTGKWQVNVR